MDQGFGTTGEVGAALPPWGTAGMAPRLLADAMERGSLHAVRYLLSEGGFRAALEDAGLASLLAEADAWKRSACEHEAIHGPGSKLDMKHRFNREVLPFCRSDHRD